MASHFKKKVTWKLILKIFAKNNTVKQFEKNLNSIFVKITAKFVYAYLDCLYLHFLCRIFMYLRILLLFHVYFLIKFEFEIYEKEKIYVIVYVNLCEFIRI